jgi:hypothetical protein
MSPKFIKWVSDLSAVVRCGVTYWITLEVPTNPWSVFGLDGQYFD